MMYCSEATLQEEEMYLTELLRQSFLVLFASCRGEGEQTAGGREEVRQVLDIEVESYINGLKS